MGFLILYLGLLKVWYYEQGRAEDGAGGAIAQGPVGIGGPSFTTLCL